MVTDSVAANNNNNNHVLSPSTLSSPFYSSSLFRTSTSNPGHVKQTIIAIISLCVVGYLAIVYFELSPSADITAVTGSSLFFNQNNNNNNNNNIGGEQRCHQHYHNEEDADEILTEDKRIDHLLYRTLKLAIQQGNEKQASEVAVELVKSYQKQEEELTHKIITETKHPSTSSAAASSSPESIHIHPSPPPPPIKLTAEAINEAVAAIVNNRSLAEWDDFYSTEERVNKYITRDSYHLMGNHIFSGSGCKIVDGTQCSADSLELAQSLCDSFDECLGFVCNKARTDCQLRVYPLEHAPQGGFKSYYKSSKTLAAADVRANEKKKRELALMSPGSRADDHFDFDGECGKDGYKCVISYGLYGTSPKYVEGALENIKLQPSIFPGWIVRIYHDNSVPQQQLTRLHNAGAELVNVVEGGNNNGGDIDGMFWRFLVADDDSVDRYIIRDTDSRLNPREKAAVDEWLKSGYSVHSIRDHPNHDRPLNGGLWGGVKGAVKGIRAMIKLANRNGYGADLSFLCDKVWPLIKYDQIGHDSYSCHKYVNSVPFPTKRPDDFQHVGQVFENNQPREGDILCCMKNNPNPLQCRKDPSWTYG